MLRDADRRLWVRAGPVVDGEQTDLRNGPFFPAVVDTTRPGVPAAAGGYRASTHGRRNVMPSKSANVKNEKQYEALKDKGMSKQRAARIANSPKASEHGGKASHSGRGKSNQGGTTAQHKAAGRKGGKAAAKKH